ncbi:hypothetical protein [Francisella tularensis]|uniref:hypothetical protein n=1 Tax=Francisella tularensis TaxID=263 RepID=UPI0000E26BDD|nr:hypothetical protein [Francisella tularensis]ABI82576.1 hypothetical protein FTH_0616 [Francisella tularensis subsp. holarctica OSU18]AFX70314.1 hypothetical protein F92_03355 [Francisella tularensis subsp. holarctica F92]AHH46116.1 hypothetical protein X557_03275 [Francisella tularensis subsp. holarctica PHIT-FT049]AKO69028.1 hypothetical protein AAX59_07295 [Francisella tularensis subsp. holarctica]EDN36718.1 conserved hypothetical protein [Francisella tularensis subsp. novicida GA99-3549
MISLTPESTADNSKNSSFFELAIILARLVLPTPGFPHSTKEQIPSPASIFVKMPCCDNKCS